MKLYWVSLLIQDKDISFEEAIKIIEKVNKIIEFYLHG